MKTILAILSELITQIKPECPQPNPKENVLWVLIPKAKVCDYDWTEYDNSKTVWVGFKADQLVDYTQRKSSFQIVFRVGQVFLNQIITNCLYAFFNLSHLKGYRVRQKGDKITLTVPQGSVILPKPIIPRICITRVNQTVFVDPKYGSDSNGQIEEQLCPFKTINAAIEAIPPSRLLNLVWEIQLTAGNFPEVAIIPSYVYLIGQGISLTTIAGLHIIGQGQSGASNLTVESSGNPQMVPPVLITYAQPDDPLNYPIVLSNINIIFNPISSIPSGEFNVVEIRQSSGRNGTVILRECQVNANFTEANLNQSRVNLLRTINLSKGVSNTLNVELRTSTFRMTTPSSVVGPSELTLVRNTRTNLTDNYGRYIFRSRLHSELQQIFFSVEGETFQQNHPTIRLELLSELIPPMYPDYTLWLSSDIETDVVREGGYTKVSSPDVNLVEVAPSRVILANTLGELSRVRVLGGSFPDQGLPKILPGNNQITYAGHDKEGGTINKGSLATRIRRSSENQNIIPEDQTVLVDTADDLHLYSIPEVSQRQIVQGSILTIKNTLLIPVIVHGDIAGTVPSQGYQLKPLESIQLNADQSQFYLTNSSVQEIKPSVPYPLITGPIPVPPFSSNMMMILLSGASGGGQYGGKGGIVTATLPYDSANNYQVVIGTQPDEVCDGNPSPGGIPGGGPSGGAQTSAPCGAGGGGYSAIILDDEILILAAGGGGQSIINRFGDDAGTPSVGGDAGNEPSGDGNSGESGIRSGGGGSTSQGIPGAGGKTTTGETAGFPGTGPSGITGGNGGAGGTGNVPESIFGIISGGGGGGGYYGGGGGAGGDSDNPAGAAGGGGSSFVAPSITGAVYKTGQKGNGAGYITWLSA